MHEHNIRLLRYECEPVADGVLPLRTAFDHLPRSKPLDTAEQSPYRGNLIRTNGNNQLADLGHLGKCEQRPQEHGLARKCQKDLVQPCIHPMRLSRRRKNHTNHAILHPIHRASLAKIIRPAAV